MNRKAWYILNRRDFKATNVGGCILWLRGDMGITPNGANVAGWADQSGQGNDAAQATPTDQPAFEAAGGPNSTPCVTFDAANTEFLDLGAMTDASNDYTVFAVLNQTSTAGTQTVLGSAAAQLLSAAHTATLAAHDGTAYRDIVVAKTGAQIATWRLDATGTAIEVYRDGTKLGSGTYDATWTWAAPELGKTPGGADHLDAKVAEVIVYNRKLTAAEVALVHAYLSARYAITFDLKTSIAGNILWLDAALGVTSTGSGVSTWLDQGPSGNNATQATDADRPLYEATAGPGGLPCLHFDLANTEHMDLASATGTTNDLTVCALVNPLSTATVQALISSVNPNQLNLRTNTVNVGMHDGTAWRAIAASTTGAQYLTYILDSATPDFEVRRNGASLGVGVYDATFGAWGAASELGGVAGVSNIDARLCRIAAYSHVLTDEEMALVETAIKAGSGL